MVCWCSSELLVLTVERLGLRAGGLQVLVVELWGQFVVW